MAELDTEERISALEREVAELKTQLQQMIAGRKPLDELRSEIQRVNREVAIFSAREQAHEDYMRARLGVIEFDLGSINRDIAALQTGLQELREESSASFQDLRIGQQAIAAGLQQLTEFIMGRAKKND